MKIKGVASTAALDSDQEVLEPSGFVLDKFLKSGFINYNHKSGNDPAALIGEPTKAYIEKNELHIEGLLYPDNPIAKSVYQMAQVLEKNSETRRLGYSIEGKVMATNPNDKKHITKAKITGLAITPTPKNPKTLMELMKGEQDQFTDFTYSDTDYSELEKAIEADGGDTGYEDTKKESVEGSKSNKKKKKIKNLEIDSVNMSKALSQGEIYVEILGSVTKDIKKAKQIYSLVEKISSMENINITQETIQKAHEILALADGSAETQLEKSESVIASEKAVRDAEATLKLAKSEHAAAIAPTKVQPGVGAPDGTAQKDQGEKDKDGDDTEIMSHAKKSDDFGALSSESITNDIIKGLGPKFGAIGDLFENQEKDNIELKKSIEEQGNIIALLGKRLNLVEHQKPTRKSMANTSFINKGEDNEMDQGNLSKASTFSVSRDKGALVDFLYGVSNIEKGENVNKLYAQASSNLETSGMLAGTMPEVDEILKALKEEHNINVVA
jgi:hypothetical protein